MAETSGFFNARIVDGTYDRSYDASTFAEYFSSFVGNGVFQNVSSALMVTENTTPNMSVRVLPGFAFIDGYWYKNSESLVLSVEVADGVYNRIDSIVLRYDYDERLISLVVKKGAPAPSPVAPELIRNNQYYELELAQIILDAGTSNVRNQNIVDYRSDSEHCGWVQSAVQTIDTTYFGNQLNQFITRYIAKADAEYEEYVDTINEEYFRFQTVFNDLLERLRRLIDDDDALGQLLIDQTEQGEQLNTLELNYNSYTQQTDGEISSLQSGKENRYSRVSVNVSVDDWVQNEETEFWEYSFEHDYPASDFDIEIDLDWDGITQDQIKDYSRAGIVGSHVTNKLVARSKQPTMDYPMMLFVTYRGVS